MTKFLSVIVFSAAVSSIAACRKPAADKASASDPSQPTATSGQTSPQPAPVKPMPAQLPDVLARVNGEAVTKVDFDRLIKNMELRGDQPIPAERRDAVYRQVLDELVTYTVLSQETRARQVAVTDEEVESAVKQMRGRMGTDEDFKKALDARGMTLDKLKADTRVDISINKMVEAEVATQPAPTDVQVRDFYDKNPDKFKQDEAVRASHILFRVDENADATTKKKAMDEAQSVLKQARGGADFAELAKKHSADGSAAQGGDLNFFTRGQMVPPFDQAAFGMKPGEISDIVTTQFGYHIIKVTERRAPSTVPFDQVSDRIKEFLTQQQKQQKADGFIQSLKQKAKIEVLV